MLKTQFKKAFLKQKTKLYIEREIRNVNIERLSSKMIELLREVKSHCHHQHFVSEDNAVTFFKFSKWQAMSFMSSQTDLQDKDYRQTYMTTQECCS